MFKILVDADLILDSVMNRTELSEDVSQLLEKVHPSIQIHLTDVGLQKISAYTYCLNNPQIPELITEWLQQKIQMCIVNQKILQKARYSYLKDFESAVEFVCFKYYQLDAIVTNKPEDFPETGNKNYIWSFTDLWLRANLETQLETTIPS